LEIQSNIFIRNLRLYAFHGVMRQERKVGGWYVVSLRVHYYILRAMETDDVANTISYADLCELVKREMAQPAQLLESVAGRIAHAVIESYPEVASVDITLTKENPPMGVNCEGAGVELHLINNKTQG
jgi:dihydroneopterin aldolase